MCAALTPLVARYTTIREYGLPLFAVHESPARPHASSIDMLAESVGLPPPESEDDVVSALLALAGNDQRLRPGRHACARGDRLSYHGVIKDANPLFVSLTRCTVLAGPGRRIAAPGDVALNRSSYEFSQHGSTRAEPKGAPLAGFRGKWIAVLLRQSYQAYDGKGGPMAAVAELCDHIDVAGGYLYSWSAVPLTRGELLDVLAGKPYDHLADREWSAPVCRPLHAVLAMHEVARV